MVNNMIILENWWSPILDGAGFSANSTSVGQLLLFIIMSFILTVGLDQTAGIFLAGGKTLHWSVPFSSYKKMCLLFLSFNLALD